MTDLEPQKLGYSQQATQITYQFYSTLRITQVSRDPIKDCLDLKLDGHAKGRGIDHKAGLAATHLCSKLLGLYTFQTCSLQ